MVTDCNCVTRLHVLNDLQLQSHNLMPVNKQHYFNIALVVTLNECLINIPAKFETLLRHAVRGNAGH